MSFTPPGEMHVIHCVGCDIEFWVTQRFYRGLVKSGRNFFCPNGHGLRYPKPKPEDVPKKTGEVIQFNKDRKITLEG